MNELKSIVDKWVCVGVYVCVCVCVCELSDVIVKIGMNELKSVRGNRE